MSDASQASAPACDRSSRSSRQAALSSTLFRSRVVRYREAAIHHYLCADGKIRRYVVLESKVLRQKLGKPRRCEIDPFVYRDGQQEMRTSDAWERVEQEAVKSLRLLYSKVKEIDALEGTPVRRVSAPGKFLPVSTEESASARGHLLYAGPRDGLVYCVDLLDEDTGQVRRISGIDLARALEQSGAKVGEVIRVVRLGSHSVTIREQTQGSHGEAKSTFQRSRDTYEIVREGVSGDVRARAS